MAGIAGKTAVKAIENSRRNMLIAVAVALALSGILGFLTFRRIVHPICGLQTSVESIAAGDYAKTVPFIEVADETGALARSVDVLKQGAASMEEQRWVNAPQILGIQRSPPAGATVKLLLGGGLMVSGLRPTRVAKGIGSRKRRLRRAGQLAKARTKTWAIGAPSSRIPAMTCRRGMLLAILLYVTLDLSVPTIPGAFVFESDDSVEISSGRAGEGKVEAADLPALTRESFVMLQPPVDLRDRLAATSKVALVFHPVLQRLPRASPDSAPPSEDPH